MSLENGKCPNCAANIQVDTGMESVFCSYCGTKVTPSAAIAKFKVEFTGKVNVDGVNTVVQLKASAEKSLAAGQYRNAYLDFRKAIEIDRTDYEAYWGIVKVHMAAFPDYPLDDSTDYAHGVEYREREHDTKFYVGIRNYMSFWITEPYDFNTSRIPEHVYIVNVCKSAISYAPGDKADYYKKIIDKQNNTAKYGKIKMEQEKREVEIEYKKYMDQRNKWVSAGLCYSCGGEIKGLIIKKCVKCGARN